MSGKGAAAKGDHPHLQVFGKGIGGQWATGFNATGATKASRAFPDRCTRRRHEIWIGGWALDSSDTKQCRWFSEKLCHANAPWLFTGGEGYRQIASLELLATLAAVLVFVVPVNMRSKMHCSAGTDNKGNSHVVARLLTTKFPLAAFLSELAMQLQCVGADLELYWLPRLQNQEADALMNGCA